MNGWWGEHLIMWYQFMSCWQLMIGTVDNMSQPIALGMSFNLSISNLNLLGLFSTERSKRDLENRLSIAIWDCGVLQCVAVCCSVLQCVAVCCSVLRHVDGWGDEQLITCYPGDAVIVLGDDEQVDMQCCSVLQCVAVCCSVLQCVAVCCSVLQEMRW